MMNRCVAALGDLFRLGCCGLVLVAMLATSVEAGGNERPNIIFIMADDLGYGDLGCYGQALIKTPHIDQLAAEGMRFTQAYAGAPVCTASRAVLMTGLHNGHTPARDNIPHYETYLGGDDITVATVLNKAGYRCGGVGKWSLGDAGTVGRATNQGFDMWFGYLNQDHAHHYFTEYLDDNEGRLELTGNGESHAYYSHDLLVDRALGFIRQAASEPFFLYAAFTLPHFSAREEDPDGLAVPSTEPYCERDWDSRSKKYAAMIYRFDQGVGRIVQLVEELKLRNQTLIIVTSDNGGHEDVPARFRTNGPLRGFKRDLTEGGIRVPFIAHWPGVVPAGRVNDEVIGFQDMMPTFAELAGEAAGTRCDGISVASALRGRPLPVKHEFLYWDYGHCRDRYDQAVRWRQWKGIRYGQHGPVVLFDLEQDVGETTDVAEKHHDVVQRLNEIMQTAVVPSERYPVGEVYHGKALWQP